MYKRIEELSNGEFRFEQPKVNFTYDDLEFEVAEDDIYHGRFVISSTGKFKLEGTVYSSTFRFRLGSIVSDGDKLNIEYDFTATALKAGEKLNENVYIITDCGEFILPLRVTIVDKKECIDENIKDMKDFCQLVKKDFKAGFELFKSEKFLNALENDQLRLLYKAFGQNNPLYQDLEEFLVAASLKDKVGFRLSTSSTTIKFSDLKEYEFDFSVIKDNWGYCDIRIETDNYNILSVKKNTQEEEDNELVLNYKAFVDLSKIKCKNYQLEIKVSSAYESKTLKVNIEKEIPVGESSEISHTRQVAKVELLTLYKEFRLNNLSLSMWLERSMEHILDLAQLEPDNWLYTLMRAQFLLMGDVEKNSQEAILLADRFFKEYDGDEDVLRAYGLYIRCLTADDGEAIRQYKEEIRSINQKIPNNYQILWFLLYIDDEYEDNYKKFNAIYEFIEKGNCAPLILIEAINLINEDPLVVVNLDRTIVYIFYRMMKEDSLEFEAANRFMSMISGYKVYNPRVLDIAMYCAKKYENDTFTSIMCRYLIKCDRKDSSSLVWYEKAVEKDMRITGIYEYYINSIDLNEKRELPKVVFMYFRYNSNIDNKRKAYLYANLIKVKDKYPDMYKAYTKSIDKFVRDQLEKRNINANLAKLYNHVVYSQMITEETVEDIIHMASYYKLVIGNKDIITVNVVYSKFNRVYTYDVVNGISYIRLLSKDYVLVFIDKNGVRTCTKTTFFLTKMINFDELLKRSLRMAPYNAEVLVMALEEGKKLGISGFERLIYESNALGLEEISSSYKDVIANDVTKYYMESDTLEYFKNFVEAFKKIKLNPSTKNSLAKVYYKKGFYEEAYEIISNNGCNDWDNEKLSDLAMRIVHIKDYEYDYFLTWLCYHVFSEGSRDETVIRYLVENYNGFINNMIMIYNAAMDKEIAAENLAQKIVEKTLITGESIAEIENIFIDYYKYAGRNTTTKAYFASYSYNYILKDIDLKEDFFEAVEEELKKDETNNEHFILNICKLAYLKYLSVKKELHKEEEITKYLDFFASKNIFLNFFKDFDYELIKGYMFNSLNFIEYKSDPDNQIYINYHYMNGEDGEDLYIKEKMECVIPGIFSKAFSIFYKDILQYYITEKNEEGEKIVESGSIRKTNNDLQDVENVFDYINEIDFCIDMDDRDSLESIVSEFENKRYVTRKIFKLM
ncbi:DUF5717 family protein [Acetitomaculum ruminis]|uniref:DUF5717 family protein n=1 Tax=Acetitomaculum ruminis TaxID=2382 RepID=UPI000B84792D|nr:DUF5717 family protein [Acetitomaculum ruminis]